MNSESRKRVQTTVPLLLTLILVFSTIGCLLLRKVITDEDTLMADIPPGVPMSIFRWENTGLAPICLGFPRTFQASAKLTNNGAAGPDHVDLFATVKDSKDTVLGSQAFFFLGKQTNTGSTFKTQKHNVNELTPGNCLTPGQKLSVEFITSGGDFRVGSKIKYTIKMD